MAKQNKQVGDKPVDNVEETILKEEVVVDEKKEEVVEKKSSKKEDVVEIKRVDFERMMAQMDKQTKDIDMLYRTADKSRIAHELNKAGENLIKQGKVRLWDNTDKLVIGWKLTTDRCEVVQGKWIEEQITNVVLDDGEILTVPLIEFYRKTLKKSAADIIARTQELDKDNNQVTILKLQFPSGKVLLLDSVFVN